jgi:hypothetical protein
MHPLARRIALLVSGFSLLIGAFLLGYNLHLIDQDATTVALNLWPVLLIAAGIILVGDSTRKRAFAVAGRAHTVQFPLPETAASETDIRVQFSYGRLVAGRADGAPRLVTEQVGAAAAPSISEQSIGDRTEVAVAISQPLFPSHFQLHNTWRLELPAERLLRLFLHLHEADLRMDLRELSVEHFELSAEAGDHEVFLGRPARKLTARVKAAGGTVRLVLPPRVFTWVRLLNPFCRVDYPQGDLQKNEDGSLVSVHAQPGQGTVEVEVDGPVRTLVLDIDEPGEA